MSAMPFVYATQSHLGTPIFIDKALLPYLPAWLFFIAGAATGLSWSGFRLLSKGPPFVGDHRSLVVLAILPFTLAPLVIPNVLILVDDYLDDYRIDWRWVASQLLEEDPDLILFTPLYRTRMLNYVYRGPARIEGVPPKDIPTYTVPDGSRVVMVRDRQESLALQERLQQFRDVLSVEGGPRRPPVVRFGEAAYTLEDVNIWTLSNPWEAEPWTTTAGGYLVAKQGANFRPEIPEGREFTLEVSFGSVVPGQEIINRVGAYPTGSWQWISPSAAADLGITYASTEDSVEICVPADTPIREIFWVREGITIKAIRAFEGCNHG